MHFPSSCHQAVHKEKEGHYAKMYITRYTQNFFLVKNKNCGVLYKAFVPIPKKMQWYLLAPCLSLYGTCM